TVLLMTMSMPYSRYFSTAMATDASSHRLAIVVSPAKADERKFKYVGMNVATVNAAATANHFSCNRSSPDDRLKRTISPVRPTTGGAMRRRVTTSANEPVSRWTNGSGQLRVANTTAVAVATAYAPAMNHAAGRHRGDGSRPVGKSSRKNANTDSVRIQ